MENYPDEFTMLYQRPQADMAGTNGLKLFSLDVFGLIVNRQHLIGGDMKLGGNLSMFY